MADPDLSPDDAAAVERVAALLCAGDPEHGRDPDRWRHLDEPGRDPYRAEALAVLERTHSLDRHHPESEPEPGGGVRQLLVHPAVWPHLTVWLAGRGIDVVLISVEGDVLPTYVMTPAIAGEGSGGG